MTIDTDELRRKLRSDDLIDHIDIHSNVKPVLTEILDRLEAAENEVAHIKEVEFPRKVRAVAAGWETKCARLEQERDALRAKIEAAEKSDAESIAMYRKARDERDELRAKIEAMERQEPVWFIDERGEPKRYHKSKADYCKCGGLDLLYALPGAQPAPIIPEGWKPIPEKHPTFDLVDLRLADGSVLCGCIPQSDGDYWWDGPSGEVFIDPKYAPVTHWRLSVAQEAKP